MAKIEPLEVFQTSPSVYCNLIVTLLRDRKTVSRTKKKTKTIMLLFSRRLVSQARYHALGGRGRGLGGDSSFLFTPGAPGRPPSMPGEGPSGLVIPGRPGPAPGGRLVVPDKACGVQCPR
jgi:hypothetical protein